MALSAIHRVGIVHRDLKPGNIILSPYGPKVIDFGIAQIEDAQGRTGPVVFGTPSVIAPERFMGRRATAASDVYSWGCVVAYAGTGRWPYGGGALEAVHRRSAGGPPDLDGLDARLAPLVKAALSPDPAARPTVGRLLEEMTGSGLQIPPAVEVPDVPPQPVDGRNGTRRLIALTLGTVALIAVGTYALWPDSGSGLVRHDGFDGRHWWPEGRFTRPAASAELADGRYRLTVTGAARGGLPASANVDTSRYGDVLVSARAKGTGSYGVWCRGDPPRRPTAKYEFHVTGKGEAAVVKRAANGQGTDLMPFRPLFTPASTNHVEARCQGERNGVRLSLRVNGRHVTAVTDTSGALGPGAVGVIAAARGGTEASVDFDTFTVEVP